MATFLHKKYTTTVLIGSDLMTNSLPVLCLLFLDWKIFSVMLLYWIDTMIFFMIFLNWFIFASSRRIIGKFLLSFIKLVAFVFFVFIQSYCIFVFTGQFYFSRDNTSEEVVSNINVSFFDVLVEMGYYISELVPLFLSEEPFLVLVVAVFIINHIVVFIFPDRDAMYESFRSFFLRLAFPTFSILTISIVAALALIFVKNETVNQVAFYTTLGFIVLKIYYDIKRILKRKKFEKEFEQQTEAGVIILEDHHESTHAES